MFWLKKSIYKMQKVMLYKSFLQKFKILSTNNIVKEIKYNILKIVITKFEN